MAGQAEIEAAGDDVASEGDWAFADALIALGERGHHEDVRRLVERWPRVNSAVLRLGGIEPSEASSG